MRPNFQIPTSMRFETLTGRSLPVDRSAARRRSLGFRPPQCGCELRLKGPARRTLSCATDAPQEATPSFVHVLDRLIVAANGLPVVGARYKPYWLLSDLAMAAAMGFAWMFSIHFPEVSFFGLCAGLVGALVAYKIIREAKAAFGMVAARSFLQDCLLIIIPAFLATNVGFGSPISFVTAFLGLLMPLYGGIVRIGCFLGGCCYGRRSRNGVLYPRELFEFEQ